MTTLTYDRNGCDTARRGFAALGMNNWFGVEFDNFSIHQAGDRWAEKSPCGAAKVGDVLTVRNCSTNGLAVDDQEWELKSSWQLKHIPSGLCAEAESLTAGSKVKLAECHPIGAEEGDLQQFTNDYTRIRNAMAPMTLSDRQVNYPHHVLCLWASICEWLTPLSS
jgi:hypothetical protein